MRKIVGTVLTVIFLLLLVVPAQAAEILIPKSPPVTFEEAAQYANTEIAERYGLAYDFYIPKNISNASLNKTTWNKGVGVDCFKNLNINEKAKILAYGDPWHDGSSSFGIDRYLGYTRQGHPFSNPEHPFDTDLRGKQLENFEWIRQPWRNEDVNLKIQSELGNLPFDDTSMEFCGDPSMRESMAVGLLLDGYEVLGQHQPVIGERGLYLFPWHEYVYVYHPATQYNWGVGRMFRYTDPSRPSVNNIAYKTVLMPPKSMQLPDYYPTPREESIWQESYLSNAKTYIAEPGQEICIPISIHNQGGDRDDYITDFAATWFGSGWDNPLVHEQNLSISAGGKQDFEIKVIVPQPGEENRLVIKTNVNGMTPALELPLLQANNLMIVSIGPEELDIAVDVEAMKEHMELDCYGEHKVKAVADIFVYRQDTGSEPVNAEVTITSPAGTRTESVTIPAGEEVYLTSEFWTKNPGTYTITAKAVPTEAKDKNMSNNQDSCTITITRPEEPERQDFDSGIRGGLGG